MASSRTKELVELALRSDRCRGGAPRLHTEDYGRRVGVVIPFADTPLWVGLPF